MKDRVKDIEFADGKTTHLAFYCQGCECLHQVRIIPKKNSPAWGWNNKRDNPTFSPSIKTFWSQKNDKGQIEDVVCHLFVQEGRIKYCNDSTHELAGKTVELLEVDDWSV